MQSHLTLFYVITYYSFTALFSTLFSRVLLDLTNNLVIWEFPPDVLCELLVLATCHIFAYFTPPPIDLVCLVIFRKYPVQIIKLQIDHLFSFFLLVGQSQKRTEFEYRYLWQRNTCFMTLKQLRTFVAVLSSCAFHLCVGDTNIAGKTLYHLPSIYRVLEDCDPSTGRFQAV